MAIGLKFNKTSDDLTGQSKWWGAPDLPLHVDYPCNEQGDPLTFVCQIRLEDIAPYDTDSLLPHSGMLYFFAAIGEYINLLDEPEGEHNGLGEWSADSYKIIYSPSCDELEPFQVLYDDGEPAYLPAEALSFENVGSAYESFKLLGRPYYDEIAEEYPGKISLLQIDENDEWELTLYDCGMICFMIDPEALKEQQWDEAAVYFHSF